MASPMDLVKNTDSSWLVCRRKIKHSPPQAAGNLFLRNPLVNRSDLFGIQRENDARFSSREKSRRNGFMYDFPTGFFVLDGEA